MTDKKTSAAKPAQKTKTEMTKKEKAQSRPLQARPGVRVVRPVGARAGAR